MDNYVNVAQCKFCGELAAVSLIEHNDGRCFRCACAEASRLDHKLHAALELRDPSPPAVSHGRD